MSTDAAHGSLLGLRITPPSSRTYTPYRDRVCASRHTVWANRLTACEGRGGGQTSWESPGAEPPQSKISLPDLENSSSPSVIEDPKELLELAKFALRTGDLERARQTRMRLLAAVS